jgi:hypothetical protein
VQLGGILITATGPVGGGVGCVVTGQVSGHHTRGGKLKNWKSEKLTPGLPTWPARISGFQNFRFSPSPASPGILPIEPGLGHGAGNFQNETETV